MPQDDAHPHEVSEAPAGNQHAQPDGATAPAAPPDCSTHRPPLPPGEVPAAWLPQPGQQNGQAPPAQWAPGQYPPAPQHRPDGSYPTGAGQPGGPPGQYDPYGPYGAPQGPPQNQPGQPPTGGYPAYPQEPGAPGTNPPPGWFQGQYPPGQPFQPGRPFQPGGQGWNLPERKRKTPEEIKASALLTRERLRLFIIMVIGLLIVSQLTLPFRLAGIPLGLATGFVGIRVLIGLAEMRRAGLGARGVVFTLFGLGLTGMLLLVLVSQAVYYPVVSDLENCQARANTEVAEQACVDETNDRFDSILDDLNQRARTT